MKLLLSLFFVGAFSNVLHHYMEEKMHHMMTEKLIEKLEITDPATKIMLIMQPGLLGGNEHQANQMSPIIHALHVLEESGDNENANLMMMMMMQNGGGGTDMDAMLPLLMMGDGQFDFKSMFLLTSMMDKGNVARLSLIILKVISNIDPPTIGPYYHLPNSIMIHISITVN